MGKMRERECVRCACERDRDPSQPGLHLIF